MEMKKLWDEQVCTVPGPLSWSKTDHWRKQATSASTD